MSWSEAAERFVQVSQAESDSIEEADAFRRSGSLESVHSSSSTDAYQAPMAPELFWAEPLMKFLHKKLGCFFQDMPKVSVVSGCSGTLAEATVLQDHPF